MIDAINRFSTRVESYAKYRPGYPDAVVELLKSECGLTGESIIADVGSGTGILSELFLKNGNSVIGIEPNVRMRESAERLLKDYPNFSSIEATAESTALPAESVDFITAAQAFHWFDRKRTKAEFQRILKSDGWVVLLWNERRLDSTPFLRAYEDLLLEYGTDYQQVRHENVNEKIAEFFWPERFILKSFENFQRFDFESLKGRVFSASYTPQAGDPRFEPMLSRLAEIFQTHNTDGVITIEQDTRAYYGHLVGS